jgi:hypothetical protein
MMIRRVCNASADVLLIRGPHKRLRPTTAVQRVFSVDASGWLLQAVAVPMGGNSSSLRGLKPSAGTKLTRMRRARPEGGDI